MNSSQPKPKSAALPVLSLPDKVIQEQVNHQRWATLAGNPNLSPRAHHAAVNLARSSAAALELGHKALAYNQAAENPDFGESDPALVKLLGLPIHSPQVPQPSSDQPNPPS